jgi:dCMP deaminase
MMKDKFIDFYMGICDGASNLSHCNRAKVGAVIVKDDNIISWGYNGTPEGFDNCCEDKILMPVDYPQWNSLEDIEAEYPFTETDERGNIVRYKLSTKNDVLHAEMNAILKLAASDENSQGATLFCTFSPCEICSILIIKAKIKEVYYRKIYRTTKGLQNLRKAGIKLVQVGEK